MKFDWIHIALALIIGAAAGMAVGAISTKHDCYKKLHAYDEYNKAAEELLNDLDNRYGWADAVDNDDYYQSRAKLDSLLWGN